MAHSESLQERKMSRVLQAALEEELECMAACQLHKSWISDAELIAPPLLQSPATPGGGASLMMDTVAMPWVLSASNGGEIALWDPSIVDSRGTFSQVAEAQGVHRKGIFGMHVCPTAMGHGVGSHAASIEVLSCSKDCSVALTTVKSTGIEVVRAWQDVHQGVAKAVCWRDAKLAASAGNDRCVGFHCAMHKV